MNFSRNQKRLLIFLIIPILMITIFLSDDLVFRIISALILVIYVGFIIFLRDSVKVNNFFIHDRDADESEIVDSDSELEHDTEPGEDFKIVSPNKEIEILTADSLKKISSKGRKNIFKPKDLKDTYERIANEEFPQDLNHDAQFGFVLEKMLNVVKDAFLAHSAIYFWFNKTNKRITMERFVSSSNDLTKRKFDLEDDVLSKIIINEEPELLTDISNTAESDVIRYYSYPQGIKSFVGVPLFYNNELTGVLILDSKDMDAFGIESIYSLGRFVRVISIIIALFEDKFSSFQSDQRLKGMLNAIGIERDYEDQTELFDTIENTMKQVINWDCFTFVFYNTKQNNFICSRVNNKTSLKYIGEGLEVDINNTLVGKAIISGKPILIGDTSSGDFIKYTTSEDIAIEGSFMAIPLVYDNQNYGVLCLENLKKNHYSKSDIKFVTRATKVFAYILHSHSIQNLYKNLLFVDVETKIFNKKMFYKLVENDLHKAKEMNVQCSLALIKIDDFYEDDNLFENNPFPQVVSAIAKLIDLERTPMSTLARVDKKIFSVFFFNKKPNEAFVWAEKLRIKIAREPIAVISKQTTFTVSVGVANASNSTSVDEIFENAQLALDKAMEKGGNSVKSLN